jgi:hypothetical protein
MIYNLIAFLKQNFPDEIFYKDYRKQINGQKFIPDRNILIKGTGGSIKPLILFYTITFQLIVRDVDDNKAYSLVFNIYNLLNDRYGLILPSVVVNGNIYGEIQIGQLSAVQEPYCIGPDDQGRIEYLNNYYVKG